MYLSRTGRIECANKSFSGFRSLASRENRADFRVTEQVRAISMDFDLKRRPVRSSFSTVHPDLDGHVFEIANFDTEPYRTVADYRRCKAVGKACSDGGCLRTERDWQGFWLRLSSGESGKLRRISIHGSHQVRAESFVGSPIGISSCWRAVFEGTATTGATGRFPIYLSVTRWPNGWRS